MQTIFYWCRFVVLTALFTGASAAYADNQGNIRIVVYGDSMVAGSAGQQSGQSYAAKLERKLWETGFTNVTVINLSVPDMTTASALERINNVLYQQPDIVVLAVGSNDAIRGIKVDNVYGNLNELLNRLSGTYVILLGMKAPANTDANYSYSFENMYRAAAAEHKVALYPFMLDSVVGQPGMNLADGYHPNSKGMESIVNYTFPLVDAAVRWRLDVQKYQQEYHQQQMEQQFNQ